MRASYRNPAIHKAFDMLEIISADEKTRRLAEMREKALKNERSELSAAKKEGQSDVAKTLLKMGVLSVEQISEATGLSIEELQKLQKSKKRTKKL